jgi:hypothetical protein
MRAASLQREVLHRLAGHGRRLPAGLGRPGERHLADEGMLEEASPHGRAGSGHHRHETGREQIGDGLERPHDGEWGVAGRLHDHGVAGQQGRDDLDGGEGERPVPRGDGPDDPDGLVEDPELAHAVVDGQFAFIEAGGHVGVVARQGFEEPDLEAGLPGDLPLFPDEELVEALQGGDAVGRLGQDACPLHGRPGRPLGLGLAGPVDGGVHIARPEERVRAHHLGDVGRIADLAPGGIGRVECHRVSLPRPENALLH